MGFRGGREHLSKVSRPLPSARLWSRAPIDPPTRLVSTNESHLEELPWTGLTLAAEPTGPQLCFVFQSSTREVHETIYHASLWKLTVQFTSAASISVTPA